MRDSFDETTFNVLTRDASNTVRRTVHTRDPITPAACPRARGAGGSASLASYSFANTLSLVSSVSRDLDPFSL